MANTRLNINGKDYDAPVDGNAILLYVLRDDLGLTGTKFGCGLAQCGACTVHLDGAPVRACITPVSATAWHENYHGRRVGGRAASSHRFSKPGLIAGAAVRLLPVRSTDGSNRAACDEPAPQRGRNP